MRRHQIAFLALAALVLALATACSGGPSGAGTTTATAGQETETAPPATTGESVPATTEAATETEPAAGTTVLSVYFLRGEKLGVAHRRVPGTKAVGRAALEQLLEGPTPAESDAGLQSQIPAGTKLLGLSIEGGTATVDLSGGYASGGGSLTMFARLAQVVYTLTQFPTVDGVVFELDGVPTETFSSEGIVLDHPQTRADYEDLAPAILVETPAVGDTVSSPLRLTGTANTFEATLEYALSDWDGKIIANGFATATCGTGCRGTFDVSVPFEWSGEPRGSLVVFERSAKDGSRTNVVEIPLAFE
jgi:germination protein M